MRDGVRLRTDLYLPPVVPAPAIAVRTPYGRAASGFVGRFLSFARRGYVGISQDCRGTGESEPEAWDYYMYEPEDGIDFVEWISQQTWFNGFLGAYGGSYIAQTQWCMAMHPCMSTFVPQASGLGVAVNTAHLYMFANAYAGSIGKGEDKTPVHYTEMERHVAEETMAGGIFNKPLNTPISEVLQSRYPILRTMSPVLAKQWLWQTYCGLSCAERAKFIREVCGSINVTILDVESLSEVFGQEHPHDAHTLPRSSRSEVCRLLCAPPLIVTGWYDWGVNDALATWALIQREARMPIASRTRLIITPAAHNMPGYHEGIERHPELINNHSYNAELLMRWHSAVAEGKSRTGRP